LRHRADAQVDLGEAALGDGRGVDVGVVLDAERAVDRVADRERG
jgi:hypothetical protein